MTGGGAEARKAEGEEEDGRTEGEALRSKGKEVEGEGSQHEEEQEEAEEHSEEDCEGGWFEALTCGLQGNLGWAKYEMIQEEEEG